jgi:hypothetical protein
MNDLVSSSKTPSEKFSTITVAVVTADLRHAHAQKCIEHLKRHTHDYDLWILDNNNSANFNHSREINKVLKSVTTDFVVLMDDDAFVEADWLPNLLHAMDEKTGVVAPMHRDAGGALSFSGVYLMGDDFGTHAHLVDVPASPRVSQCVCSALLLIDRRKCGGLCFNEEYNKYWMDIDYSLQVWEAGYQVVCTPDVTVTHIGGATAIRDSKNARRSWNAEMRIFVSNWVDTGRLAHVGAGIWSRLPVLDALCDVPRRIRRITEAHVDMTATEFERELQLCLELSSPFPLFRSLLKTGIIQQQSHFRKRNETFKVAICERAKQQLEGTIVVHGGPSPELLETRQGYSLVAFGKEFLAIPLGLGWIDVYNPETRHLPGMLVADSLPALQLLIDAHPINRLRRLLWAADRRSRVIAKACLKAAGFGLSEIAGSSTNLCSHSDSCQQVRSESELRF